MAKKRYRTPQAKPGELRVVYGKADRWSMPDVVYAWGEGVQGADGRLAHYAFATERLTLKFPEGGTEWEPSFLKELETRGYDLSTLRFSIQKRTP